MQIAGGAAAIRGGCLRTTWLGHRDRIVGTDALSGAIKDQRPFPEQSMAYKPVGKWVGSWGV